MQIYKCCDYTSINWKDDGLKFSFNILYPTVPCRKNTVPSAINIQWFRKIDNFLLCILCIFVNNCKLQQRETWQIYRFFFSCLSHYFNTLKLKTHGESNIRFKIIFNLARFREKSCKNRFVSMKSFVKKVKIHFHVPLF